MEKRAKTKRYFLKHTAAASAGLIAGGVLPGFSASSYKRIPGVNMKRVGK